MKYGNLARCRPSKKKEIVWAMITAARDQGTC